MRWSLRTLHVLLLGTGIGLGIGLPARAALLRWKTVSAIQAEVHSALTEVALFSRKNPDQAISDIDIVRECVARSSMLSNHERANLLEQIDQQLAKSRRDRADLERRWKAMNTSCAIDVSLSVDKHSDAADSP